MNTFLKKLVIHHTFIYSLNVGLSQGCKEEES